MAVQRIVAAGGLSTDPTALDQPNALRRAENVILHRPGSIQVRPGFGDTTGIAARTEAGLYRPIQIIPFGGDLVVQSASSGAYRFERAGVATVYSGSAAPFEAADGVGTVSPWFQARGSLYIQTGGGTGTGIRKLVRISDSGTVRAGVWQTYQALFYSLTSLSASSDSQAITSDSSVAYRWVVQRKDANGYVARSAPSSRLIVRADASTYTNGASATLGTIYLPADALEDDVIELYRTTNSGGASSDPGEDYYLCATYTLTIDDITNGVTDDDILVDNVEDAQLGPALYTSQSQLGALASKEIPPIPKALAYWGHCAWAGNTLERATLGITLQQVAYESGATVRLEGTGLCYIDHVTVDTTSGSPVLTNVSLGSGLGWDAIAAGMWFSDSGPNETAGTIPLGAKIESFDAGATTITLDTDASASTTSTACKCGDIVNVLGGLFCAYSAESIDLRWFKADIGTSDNDERVYNTAVSLARVISGYAASTGGLDAYAIKDQVTSAGTGELLLITDVPEDTSLGVQCESRGGAWSPNLTTEATAPDAHVRGRLQWSAPDEPEAWPPANTTIVGGANADILALVALDNALLVWKEDGLFAVTGSAPDSWVVNEVDLSIRLLASQSVCVLGGVCYAFTDRGVVAATAGGVQIISADIATDLRAYSQLLPRDNANTKRAFWMAAHKRLGLVVLGVAEAASAEYTSREYVYHVSTGRWSTWEREDRCMAYDPAEDRMVASPGIDAWALLYERSDEDDSASYVDASLADLSCSVASATTLTISESEFDGFAPAAGDVLEGGNAGHFYRVTSAALSGGTWTLTVADPAGTLESDDTKLVDWHQGIPAIVQWQAQQMPGYSSRWSEIHVDLLDTSSEYLSSWPMAVGGATDRDSSATTLDATVDSTVVYSRPVRVGPHRNLVRASHLYPQIGVACAGVRWRVGELALHGVSTSRRVAR